MTTSRKKCKLNWSMIYNWFQFGTKSLFMNFQQPIKINVQVIWNLLSTVNETAEI